MAINGINSYGMGLYSYQSTLNNFRLTQALAKNPKLNGYTSPAYSSSYSMNSAMKSNVGFVKEYSSNMTDLMSAANALKSSNKSSIVNDLAVTSSNKDVATAEARFSMKDFAGLELDVQQIAQAQVNVSEGVKASEKAEAGMNFTVNDGTRAVNVQVDTRNRDGSTKTNAQMITAIQVLKPVWYRRMVLRPCNWRVNPQVRAIHSVSAEILGLHRGQRT